MTTIKGSKVIAKGNVTGNYITVPCQMYDYIQLGLITHTDLAVYGYLLDRYNDNYGYAFPTIPQIMIHTNIRTKKTVHKSIKNLESVGLIEKGKANMGNNVYRVFLPLERDKLYKLVPGLVDEFNLRKTGLLNMAKEDKIRWDSPNNQ